MGLPLSCAPWTIFCAASSVRMCAELTAPPDGVEVLVVGFLEGQVDRQLVGRLVVVHALHRAMFFGNDFRDRAFALERLFRRRQFHLLEAVGDQDGDMHSVQCGVHMVLLTTNLNECQANPKVLAASRFQGV
jgi:hypothetical protein